MKSNNFVWLFGIMLLFSFAFATAGDLVTLGEEEKIDPALSVDMVKPNYCYNSDFKIVECAKDIKPTETEIKAEEKLLVKIDAVYLIDLKTREEVKVEDKKDSSIYIHKKASGEVYHVDNTNDIPVETYLDFYYTKRPNVITHINKNGEKVRDFQSWEYTWTPKSCTGSGEETVCSTDGTARIFTTLTENSVGSETFPLTFSPAQWVTDNQGYTSFDGVGSYIDFNVSLNMNNVAFCHWIKSNYTASMRSLSSTGNGYQIVEEVGLYRFRLYNSSTNAFYDITRPSNLINSWTQLCYSQYNNNLSVYVNGNYNISFTTLLNPLNVTTQYIGRYSSGSFFNGSIDDVQIFNKSLNSTEITSLYNYGRQKKGICNLITDGQVACYDFDDNSFGDGSGNGNYGTPSGFNSTTPEKNDQRSLSGSDYSLTKNGSFTVLNPNFKYNTLNVLWDYDSTRINLVSFFIPLLALILIYIVLKSVLEDK